ncbi:MAG TPA: hypothetical protein VHL53_11675 [Acidimicrobiia bacterium]|nr:hypothetical protein [Acidimicrobiia bacterium]
MRLVRLFGMAALAAAALAGCTRSDAAVTPTPGPAVKALDVPGLPSDLLGLRITREDVGADLAKVNKAYVQALSLYSLRRDDLVMATLQVSRFNPGADVNSEHFRQTVVNQIGARAPRTVRLGAQTVYLTTGTKQSIAVWFKGPTLFVLATRADYDEPRTLLRRTLEIGS